MSSSDILPAAVSGALIVLCGALYALLYALAKARRSRVLMFCSHGSYAALFIACLFMAKALALGGAWTSVIVVMLAGYLLAPRAIWQLCIGTHGTLKSPAVTEQGARVRQ